MSDTKYTRDLAVEICLQMAKGEPLRSVCRDAGVPSQGAVPGWLHGGRDGFAARHREARASQLEYWADEIVDLADRGDLDPRNRQVRIDTRKWLMSKLAPRRYGDRLPHAGDPDAPILQ
jgi:hypothetical protein